VRGTASFGAPVFRRVLALAATVGASGSFARHVAKRLRARARGRALWLRDGVPLVPAIGRFIRGLFSPGPGGRGDGAFGSGHGTRGTGAFGSGGPRGGQDDFPPGSGGRGSGDFNAPEEDSRR
jgi:hypothetical protein